MDVENVEDASPIAKSIAAIIKMVIKDHIKEDFGDARSMMMKKTIISVTNVIKKSVIKPHGLSLLARCF